MSRIVLKTIAQCTVAAIFVGLILMGCVRAPLHPFSTETTPLMLVPAIQAEAQDRRGRFREIFCAVRMLARRLFPITVVVIRRSRLSAKSRKEVGNLLTLGRRIAD